MLITIVKVVDTVYFKGSVVIDFGLIIFKWMLFILNGSLVELP